MCVRSLSQVRRPTDNSSTSDVIYHANMKAFGLQQLVLLYINWKDRGNDDLGMTKRAFQGTPFN